MLCMAQQYGNRTLQAVPSCQSMVFELDDVCAHSSGGACHAARHSPLPPEALAAVKRVQELVQAAQQSMQVCARFVWAVGWA
jgi:hypothetical protein